MYLNNNRKDLLTTRLNLRGMNPVETSTFDALSTVDGVFFSNKKIIFIWVHLFVKIMLNLINNYAGPAMQVLKHIL